MPDTQPTLKSGFTLIEMSIVLVIIGFIVGGILAGKDLIDAASQRAQIAQIEKYRTAVRTFQGKYGGLPGDLETGTASQFGFYTTHCNNSGGNTGGMRDGNGLISGPLPLYPLAQTSGEVEVFWEDLTLANLIDGTFPNSGVSTSFGCNGAMGNFSTASGATPISAVLPVAKIGNGNYVYVYSINSYNWYGVSAVNAIPLDDIISANTAITVLQAYNIDNKMDDGIATTGNVVAVWVNNSQTSTSTVNAQATDSATSCYNTSSNTYSIGINGGNALNCALSFKFQ